MKNGDAARSMRPKGIQNINVAQPHKRNPSIASLIKSQRYQQCTPTVTKQYTPTLDQQLFSPLDDLDDEIDTENELRSPRVLQLESGTMPICFDSTPPLDL